MARFAGALRPALIVLIVLALLLTLVWLAQRRLVYLPDRSGVPPAAEVLAGGADATLTTSDGLQLGAWYLPPAPRAPDRELTVLVANGNGGNREARAPLAEALSRAGFAVLLFDYRGYGGNPGQPTEAGLARDVRAAHDHLTGAWAVPPERIIYFGESLGAGVVAELAARREPAGLLLRSPFTELADVGAKHYPFLPVRLMLWDRYPVVDHVAKITAPVAVVYGDRDTIIPPDQSRRVAQAAAGPVQVTRVAGADHNDAALAWGPELVSAVIGLAELTDGP